MGKKRTHEFAEGGQDDKITDESTLKKVEPASTSSEESNQAKKKKNTSECAAQGDKSAEANKNKVSAADEDVNSAQKLAQTTEQLRFDSQHKIDTKKKQKQINKEKEIEMANERAIQAEKRAACVLPTTERDILSPEDFTALRERQSALTSIDGKAAAKRVKQTAFAAAQQKKSQTMTSELKSKLQQQQKLAEKERSKKHKLCRDGKDCPNGNCRRSHPSERCPRGSSCNRGASCFMYHVTTVAPADGAAASVRDLTKRQQSNNNTAVNESSGASYSKFDGNAPALVASFGMIRRQHSPREGMQLFRLEQKVKFMYVKCCHLMCHSPVRFKTHIYVYILC